MVKSVLGGFEKIPNNKHKPNDKNWSQENLYREGKKKKKDWSRASRDTKYSNEEEE